MKISTRPSMLNRDGNKQLIGCENRLSDSVTFLLRFIKFTCQTTAGLVYPANVSRIEAYLLDIIEL